MVKTESRTYEPDTIVIAAGCDRSRQIEFVRKLLHYDRVSIEVTNSDDEVNALHVATFLARLGKTVHYSGPLLKPLGREISEKLAEALELSGIKITERGDFQFPDCEPSNPFQFFKTDEKLRVKSNVYVTGDLIHGLPKVGELAMRTGIYVARSVMGLNEPFRPIFINVLKLPKGKAIYIKTDKPWGGKTEVFKVSRFRYLTKVFLERYYIMTNGRMGFLERF